MPRARVGGLLAALAVAACSGPDAPASGSAAPPETRANAAALTLPSDVADSAGTLDSLQGFVQRVDADTARMQVARDRIDLGAGVTGTLTAWRAGASWQRIHLVAGDSAFTTSDSYWVHDGRPVGARLESARPGVQPSVEQVWFRDGRLYRWVDASGHRLNPDAQSTRSEVERLQSRLTRILEALASVPTQPR